MSTYFEPTLPRPKPAHAPIDPRQNLAREIPPRPPTIHRRKPETLSRRSTQLYEQRPASIRPATRIRGHRYAPGRAPRTVQMRGAEEAPTEAYAAYAAGRGRRGNEADAPLSAP